MRNTLSLLAAGLMAGALLTGCANTERKFGRGLNRSLARTGIGIYEVVTAPFPPYDPVCTDYLAPGPVYPDNYSPTLKEDSMFATDANLGFSGGDVMPMMPG